MKRLFRGMIFETNSSKPLFLMPFCKILLFCLTVNIKNGRRENCIYIGMMIASCIHLKKPML